ncbi:hypothetical protein H2200_010579 [Cladophialophora chaetospira]|uniref:Zn(2)-C6 fungal-type domain-containing protein n=1 Tax=Cladophialophora chaetospira TaxID=386627 RepID=A0AA38X1R6_9EURO|nr:hypothetical protein H2200_010579 [Cladophialophora chaetospira]
MAPAPTAAQNRAAAAALKQMRKGTKSCQECRRRKIKCNYPPTPPSSPSTTSPPAKKCIECATHNRTCQIQGFVVPTSTSPEPNTDPSISNSTNNDDSSTAGSKTTKPLPKARIYKRRRPVDRSSPDESGEEERPRMKMHFDRMAPVVERIAKERGGANSAQMVSNDLLASSGDGFDYDLNPGNAFANALGFDFANTGLVDAQNNGQRYLSDGFDTFLYPSSISAGAGSLVGDSASIGLNAESTAQDKVRPDIHPQHLPVSLIERYGLNPAIPLEEQSRKSSPLLSQLFNNEIFTQATPNTPQVLTEKVQTMSFSDTNNNATDAEKLLSTINSEPYLLEVLDLSIKWWIAWRDQAFALQDVFAFSQEEQWLPAEMGSTSSGGTTSSRQSPGSAAGSRTFSGDQPISLRDFVMLKLGHLEDPVSISTGLLCVALSLAQLRNGVDDSVLNISASPAEIAERVTLAVDTLVLSPTSKPEYMRDPGVLLLLMMRAKMFAESNQLRKSWLSVRQAIEVAKKIGFTEPRVPLDAGQYAAKMCPGELKKLFHRQRFVGSIMELDRLMSLCLGFPHAEDSKFTDRLAMTVLKGQAPLDSNGSKPHVSADIKMRALRRVVSIAAGRVNDRNGSADPDEAKHQVTMGIQDTLNEAAAAMPDGWWDVESHIHFADPFVAHEHLVAQMWFWQVQAFLHLPFMLKPCANLRRLDHNVRPEDNFQDPYLMSRYLCLQGCRGMIKVFTLLRSDPSLAVYICACEDFQGVFSACILMVGILIRLAFCPQTLPSPNAHVMGNVDEDLGLINELKDVFRYRAIQQGGGISKQGLKVLEELGSFLQDDNNYDADQPLRRTVVLPYFGAIHLELRPPRHLRCTKQDSYSSSQGIYGGMDPTPPSSTDQSVEENGFDFESQNVASLGMSNWEVENDSQFSMPDGSLNLDQFIFGNELGEDWEAHLPAWPTNESSWEWS